MRPFHLIAAALTALACTLAQAAAQEHGRLGPIRIFSNDFLFDGQDRWQTGSYTVGIAYARGWNGRPGTDWGDTYVNWLHSQIVAPADLTNPVLGGDRRYAGILSFGRHYYTATEPREASFGVELVATGPMTGIGGFQGTIHDLIGAPAPAVLGSQIGNRITPTLVAEVAWPTEAGGARIRPFLQAQAGLETFVRAGADLIVGDLGRTGLQIRDKVTGQLTLPAGADSPSGTSFLLGGDVAYVQSSVLLPAPGYTLTPLRLRLRAGVAHEGANSSVFYGLTWLGREFRAQSESQITGTLSLKILF